MGHDQKKQLRTPRTRVCLTFHASTPGFRDKLCEAFGIEGKPRKTTRDDIRVKNAERRAQVEKEATRSRAEPKHVREGMLGDTGEKSINGLANVNLSEVVTDLLVRGFIITGVSFRQEAKVDQKKGAFLPTNKQKWKVRIHFTDPMDIGPGSKYKHEPELEASLLDFLEDHVASLVHVWDDNPDGSANIEAIGEAQGKPKKLHSLRFDKNPRRRDELSFYYDDIPGLGAEQQGEAIPSPKTAGLTFSPFSEALKTKLGR
ncbi:MAG: hypothetical protein NUV56_01020 [Candidatus Uhrbacteria bacterium]|nr:hypothetical protein [Candidatus Uhrbacteria bacterium]